MKYNRNNEMGESYMIGDRIKKIRVFKNMTQDELVEGIASIGYLSKVENHQSVPSQYFMEEIAARLDIDIDTLSSTFITRENEEKIKEIFYNYWGKKMLSDRDITLIKLYSTELQNNKILLMVFSVLIRYFYSNSRLNDAKDSYNMSKNLLKIDNVSNDEKDALFYYLFACGVLHFELYEFEIANGYFLRAESCVPEDDRQKARLYYNLSLLNERFNKDISLCLYYSGKAYMFMKKTGDNNRVVNILLVRAIQYYLTNNSDQGEECIREAENLKYETNDIRLKLSIIYSYGTIYQMKKDYKRSIQYFTEYINLAEEEISEKVIKGYKRLITIYIELRDWEQAHIYLRKTQTLATKYKKVFIDKESKLLEIEIYKIMQSYERYEKEMQKLINICEENKDFNLGIYLSSELGNYYFSNRAYKKSATYFNKSYGFEQQQLENNNILWFKLIHE